MDALLFGETQGRILISTAASNVPKILMQAKVARVPATRIGLVGGTVLKVKLNAAEIVWDLAELHDAWWNSIARAMR